jgi:hypothetical protein
MKSFALQIGSWWFHLTTLCSKQLEARWKRHEEKQKNIFDLLCHDDDDGIRVNIREREPPMKGQAAGWGRQLWKSIFTVIKKMLNKGERESSTGRSTGLSTETRYLSYNKVFLVVRARCKTQWTYSAPCWTVWKHDTRKWWEDINIYQTQKSLAASSSEQKKKNRTTQTLFLFLERLDIKPNDLYRHVKS